ncbi:proteasome-associated protein ECM29 homolog [Limulus polyphemus]|uniref:Proteasome-associated protein ECM29 homolog n=1 Tax=Limulus polyphemus TaxID=6850 RepID=A0ABM1B8X4_LIMPO|nr:proteasome-associated protein ECM29 homolog [Limulus polyphemus]
MAVQDEMVLLERVFLRIGAAETDEQLQNALAKFLPPVLLKLSSPQEGVRKKVMELLVHINKRLKSRPLVQLPVDGLLLQYQDPAATSFIVNFTIIYIKMGYPRLEISKQIEILPGLLSSLENKPEMHQDGILLMLMPVLPHVTIPNDAEKCKVLFGLRDRPKVAKLLLDYLLDFLLIPYGFARPSPASNLSGESIPPPGLSEHALKRTVGDEAMPPENLEKIKLGAVRFLACGVYPEQDIVVHLIVAASDTRHSVASIADQELRKISGVVDWNNSSLVDSLFSLFLGSNYIKDKKSTVKPEHKRSPTNTRIRLKIFPNILKSSTASTQFPAAVQVVFDALFSSNTNVKLKSMAVQFVNSICSNCSEKQILPVGKVLISGMQKLIAEPNEDSKVRNQAYVAVGMLGMKLPNLVTEDLSIVNSFFDALVNEDRDSKIAIQESLGLLSKAFCNLEPSLRGIMEALIMSKIESPVTQVRQIAVNYAASIFEDDHIPSQYILMLAAGDSKDEIRTEARKILRSSRKSEKKLPPFPDVVHYITKKADQRMKTKDKYVVGKTSLAFNPETYLEMLLYLRRCLVNSANVPKELQFDNLDPEQSPYISKYIRKLLLSNTDKESNAVNNYIALNKQYLLAFADAHVVYILLEVVAGVPDILPKEFAAHVSLVKSLMMSTKEDVREHSAKLFAIIIAHDSENIFVNSIEELLKNVKDNNLESQHGSLISVGYAIGFWFRQMKTQSNYAAKIEEFTKIVYKTVSTMLSYLKNSNSLLTSAVCLGIGEIGRNGPLHTYFEMSGGSHCDVHSKNIDAKLESKLLVKELGDIACSEKYPIKCRERAIQALGYICVGDPTFPHCRLIMEKLLQVAFEKSDVDLHFTVGDALCCAALGPSSSAARNFWVELKDDFKCKETGLKEEEMKWVIIEILSKFVVHTKPAVRQASAVWLISILKDCGNHSIVKSFFKSIQNSLLNLLADNSEITQDIASKGLNLIYELGEEQDKKELVNLLLETLTSGRKSGVTVSDDTKLFEEGMLGKLPTGGGISTYKEICSLASDLNQPDLVYKFMHLANHHTLWNSRKGAAFGFGKIAEKAGKQLSEHLPKIVPKLYRYQFDPNTATRQSFIAIWDSVVSEPQKTIDLYLATILDDLLENLTNPQWRVRESSCYAISDLIRGRDLTEVIGYLPSLWETLFLVRDDIKESVRNAAESALKVLSKVSVKLCDSTSGKAGEQALQLIIVCLIKKGLCSRVSEVRSVSLLTIVQVSKNAGPLLKPHIPLLVISLLEAISDLEPEALNYLSVKLGSEQDTQEKIDNARIAASRSSPMMETVNHCVQYMDKQVTEELVPRLVDLIRSSVGLGTKTGCSYLISNLTFQCPREIEPFAGKLLAAFINGLGDRNAAVRKSYATAIGHLVKVAKDSSVEKVLVKIHNLYLEKEEAPARSACGYTIQAMAKYSPDVLRAHSAHVLPLVFLAMFEKTYKGEKKEANDSNPWEEVWLEFTTGYETAIRLYLTEIVSLIQKGLESQSWLMKEQAATAVATMATKLGGMLKQPYLGTLLNTLLSGLSGRTWKGKESIMNALSLICVNSMDQITETEGEISVHQIIQVLVKECKKENLKYKEAAVKSLAAILEKHQLDYFGDLYNILVPILEKKNSCPHNNQHSSSEEEDPRENFNFQIVAFEALGCAWPSVPETQKKYQTSFCNLMTSKFPVSTWKVQLSILKALNCFIKNTVLPNEIQENARGSPFSPSLVEQMLKIVSSAFSVVKYSTLRMEALDVTEKLLLKINKDDLNPESVKQLCGSLTSLMENCSPAMKEKASKILIILK